MTGKDYIDVSCALFKRIQNHSGVYLLGTDLSYEAGALKVGICENLGHRIGFYRSAYAWFAPIWIFGLILLTDKDDMRRIEKDILNRFKDVKIRL